MARMPRRRWCRLTRSWQAIAEYALAQMKDIKTGARSNGQSAAMKGVMHLVNDDEMKAIAEWLAKQK